ncbi:hypothetical protein ABTW96_19815 [Nocardia beijingensis]|uniref:hypothetical protein n=1 Tax=Nocardia beijingensis TaxID=95162 RepID=UPI00332AFF77
MALIVLIAIVGAIAGGDEKTDAPESTSSALSAPYTTAPATTSSAVPAPPPVAQPSPSRVPGSPFGPSDPRCAPASAGVVDLVQPGLTHAGWRLINGTVIDSSGTTYFGATIVDGTGAVKERGDV